jgi:hypothetical protein
MTLLFLLKLINGFHSYVAFVGGREAQVNFPLKETYIHILNNPALR